MEQYCLAHSALQHEHSDAWSGDTNLGLVPVLVLYASSAFAQSVSGLQRAQKAGWDPIRSTSFWQFWWRGRMTNQLDTHCPTASRSASATSVFVSVHSPGSLLCQPADSMVAHSPPVVRTLMLLHKLDLAGGFYCPEKR